MDICILIYTTCIIRGIEYSVEPRGSLRIIFIVYAEIPKIVAIIRKAAWMAVQIGGMMKKREDEIVGGAALK